MDLAGSTHAGACAWACLHLRVTKWFPDYWRSDGWFRNCCHRSAGGTYGNVPRFVAADAGAAGDRAFSGARPGDGECEGEDSELPGTPAGSGAADSRRLAAWEPGTRGYCERGVYGRSAGDAWAGGAVRYRAPREA